VRKGPSGPTYRHGSFGYAQDKFRRALTYFGLPVHNGKLMLGTFQSVILAEFDGPRERALQLQILGNS